MEILKWKTASKMQHNHKCLPSPHIRALIVGESGCGKTTLLLNLLLQKGWLDYDKLILCGKSLHQPEYQLLINAIQKGYGKNDIMRMFKDSTGDVSHFIASLPPKKKRVLDIEVYGYDDSLPDPSVLDLTSKNLCVFDDIMTERDQTPAEAYYTRGRHNNVNCIYISQNYHRLPRQSIRSNANCLMLFKQPNKDLRHIHDDITSSDMPYDEFKQLCANIWNSDHGFLVINRSKSVTEGKYIKNLQEAYIPVSGEGVFNTLLKKLPMPEMHLKLPKDVPSEYVENGSFNHTGKYSYCGPGTKLKKRLQEGYKGVNSLDAACIEHDLAYLKYESTKKRNEADDILAHKAAEIALDESKAAYERRDARLVTGIMGTKSRFGLGIKDASSVLTDLWYNPRSGFTGINDLTLKSGLPKSVVEKWLHNQDVYALHKPIKHRFKTRRVLVNGIDDQWQADLVDMRNYKDRGYNYILTVIDVFSKFAWAIPIKRKTGEEISQAFRELFKERRPSKLHTDKGLEFINRLTKQLLKEQEVHWFATENETKAQVVERFNRTLKTRMWKVFTQRSSTKDWVSLLPDLLYNYNTSRHRSIGMTPTEASQKENEATVYRALFPKEIQKSQKPKFKVGDHVRITVKRKDFRKGYRPNFTQERFVIKEVLDTDPVTYRIAALDGEEITGSFYNEELVLSNK